MEIITLTARQYKILVDIVNATDKELLAGAISVGAKDFTSTQYYLDFASMKKQIDTPIKAKEK